MDRLPRNEIYEYEEHYLGYPRCAERLEFMQRFVMATRRAAKRLRGKTASEGSTPRSFFLDGTRSHANSDRELESYDRASFAGTAAENVHCLWHDVSIRIGPDYLPAEALRRRLELIRRWFPPDRGHHLFPPQRRTGPTSAPPE
jgi:hypothetical protein